MGFGKGALLWLIGIPLPITLFLRCLCTTDRWRGWIDRMYAFRRMARSELSGPFSSVVKMN